MGEESESRTDLTDRSKHTRRRERESEGERAYLRTSCESRYQSRHTGTKRRNTEGMPTRLERERETLASSSGVNERHPAAQKHGRGLYHTHTHIMELQHSGITDIPAPRGFIKLKECSGFNRS